MVLQTFGASENFIDEREGMPDQRIVEDDEIFKCIPDAASDAASHLIKEQIYQRATKKQDVVDF